MNRLMPLLVISMLMIAGASPAVAAGNWPADVTGAWDVVANNSTQITLTVTHQAHAGQCKAIRGTIIDPETGAHDTFNGFYCPGSGRVAFLRHIGRTSAVYQSWIGNLSHTNSLEFAGGTFFDIVNDPGEYQWFGSQKNG